MIELYLNPDQDGAWEERDSGPVDDGTSENINVAEALLKELRPKAKYVLRFAIFIVFAYLLFHLICYCLFGLLIRDSLRFRVLENYYLLATKQRSQVLFLQSS